MSHTLRFGVAIAALMVLRAPASAQAQPRALTADDYARAERFMPYNTAPLVFHAGVRATWLADGRFWYRTTTPDGAEFVLVDPARKTRGPAFDQAKLAAALSSAAATAYTAAHLPFTTFDLAADGRSVSFTVGAKRWTCDLPPSTCTSSGRAPDELAGGRGGPPPARTDVAVARRQA